MRLVSVLSVLAMVALCTGMAFADPGHVEEKPWGYPGNWLEDRTDIPEQEPNDTCPGQAMSCGDVIIPAELNPSGDHDWFQFTIDGPNTVTIGTDDDPNNPQDTDTYLELYADDCTTQLAYDDDGGPSWYSLIVIDLPAGTYNIMVRGYGDYATGSYMMFLLCEPTAGPPENDTCAGAEEFGYGIDRCTAGSIDGDTGSAFNDYNPADPGPSCTGYSANGKDVVYYMDLEAGDIVDMTYNNIDWDSSFYIVTDCSDMTTCVAGADDTVWPDPEVIHYVAEATGRYYVILDAWSNNQGGPFYLDYMIECPPPPEDEACCFDDGTCQMLLPEDCVAQGGTAQGPGSSCDTNPCEVIPAETNTWGEIKANYR